MIIKTMVLCCLAALLCGTVLPQGQPTDPSAPPSIVSAEVEDVIAKFRQEIPQRMEQENVSGMAIVVVDDQGILWAEGFGYTDTDRKTPITPETLFSIQSMSKSFTATAAMFAAQDGLVDLDAPITTYLPDFRVNSIFEEHPEQKITLRMLLSHTAGFAHEAPYGGNFDHPGFSFEKHIASISDTWLKSPVGTRYDYSNLGIDLAGYILQVRAEMPFTRYVQETVLTPLGMTSSTLDARQVRKTPGRAIGHLPAPVRPPVDCLIIPSGGVWTTAVDMARYMRFHINKGALDGTRLLGEDLAETMYTPPNLPAFHYAQGIVVTTSNGARRFEHAGGGFGFNSNMIWSPELKLGVAVLTNAEHLNLYYKLSEEVLASIIHADTELYAQRVENAVRVDPAYPPTGGKPSLSDHALKILIESKALEASEAAQVRRESYAGTYVVTKWGIPMFAVEVTADQSELSYESLGDTGPLIEVEPGLFFTPAGDTFDLRGQPPTGLNVRLVKANPQVLPFLLGFYGLCALILLSALFFWPVRAVVRSRIRRRIASEDATPVPLQGDWSFLWTGIPAALASLISLLCLAAIAYIPNLVYVPWPRPYVDLAWWQFCLFSLPFASLLLASVITLRIGLSAKKPALGRAIQRYYGLVALVLLVLNLVILL